MPLAFEQTTHPCIMQHQAIWRDLLYVIKRLSTLAAGSMSGNESHGKHSKSATSADYDRRLRHSVVVGVPAKALADQFPTTTMPALEIHHPCQPDDRSTP